MCGDNSPASKDSRLFDYWSRPMRGIQSHRYAVREKDLIGKAMFIFWPHGIPFLNDGEGFSVKGHSISESDYRHWKQGIPGGRRKLPTLPCSVLSQCIQNEEDPVDFDLAT